MPETLDLIESYCLTDICWECGHAHYDLARHAFGPCPVPLCGCLLTPSLTSTFPTSNGYTESEKESDDHQCPASKSRAGATIRAAGNRDAIGK